MMYQLTTGETADNWPEEGDNNQFVFNSVIIREETGYTSLCLDLDVASQGETIAEAKGALQEAVTLYLETALEHNLPWLRSVPLTEDPRFVEPESVVETFPLKTRVAVHVYT
jgi:predicted RNase H-like HicB family nuclease